MRKTMPAEIAVPDHPDARLRLVEWRDTDLMRRWKNVNKRFFFHQTDITPEQQKAWFEGYLARPDDHNYAVEERGGDGYETVGLLACRLLEGTVDVYNVMRGHRVPNGRVAMGDALKLLCTEIGRHYRESITCKVLRDNPAIEWYLRNGFRQAGTASDHVVLQFESPERKHS